MYYFLRKDAKKLISVVNSRFWHPPSEEKYIKLNYILLIKYLYISFQKKSISKLIITWQLKSWQLSLNEGCMNINYHHELNIYAFFSEKNCKKINNHHELIISTPSLWNRGRKYSIIILNKLFMHPLTEEKCIKINEHSELKILTPLLRGEVYKTQ